MEQFIVTWEDLFGIGDTPEIAWLDLSAKFQEDTGDNISDHADPEDGIWFRGYEVSVSRKVAWEVSDSDVTCEVDPD